MGVTIDGNSITITNATIQLINGANSESGVAYMIITPEGGTGELPFMSQGLPGQPSLFDEITFVWHPHGQPLPVPNVDKQLLDPGGPGLPARYKITVHGNVGPTGLTGSPSISGSSDLATAIGSNYDQFTLIYQHATGKFYLEAQKVGQDFICDPIEATSNGTQNPRLLSSIAIPPLPYPWRPAPSGALLSQGTGGDNTSITQVNAVCRINNASSGQMCGFGRGTLGTNQVQAPTVILPYYGTAVQIPGPGAVIPAGQAAVIHLRAEQVRNVSSNWMTHGSDVGGTYWSVRANPVLPLVASST